METKPETRICQGCKRNLLFNLDYFPKRKWRNHGMDTVCRKCTCEKAKVVNFVERKKLRKEILTKYSIGNILGCVCCGETRIEFLTLDHINGGGIEERKKYPATMLWRRLRKMGFPTGYRTLCWNCNCSIGMYGYCPHEAERKRIEETI